MLQASDASILRETVESPMPKKDVAVVKIPRARGETLHHYAVVIEDSLKSYMSADRRRKHIHAPKAPLEHLYWFGILQES